MTTDLVAFLRARLDEDKRNADARCGVFPSPSVEDDGYVWLHIRPGGNAVIVRYPQPVEGYDDMAKLRSWAAAENGWTKERVLAEVASKRAIVDGLAEADPHAGYITATFTAAEALRQLALPYADHPDYQEAWKP